MARPKVQNGSKKINRTELAKLVGVTDGAVGGWISGKREPRFVNLCKICKVLEISSDQLLFGRGDEYLTWLVKNKETVQREKELILLKECKEIWLVTRMLNNDLQGGNAFQTVQEALKRHGTIYKYIVPNTPEIRHSGEILRDDTFKGHENKLEIVYVSEFDKHIPYDQLIIFNPDSPSPEMYLEIPSGTDEWYVRLSHTHAKRFIGQIIILLQKQSIPRPNR